MNLTSYTQRKRKKSIFRKTMAIFVLVVLVPTAMLGMKNYRVFSEQVQVMEEAGVLSGELAQKQLYERKVQILTYEGYGIVVTLILGYFLANSIVQPIRTLQKGARRIGKGNLDFRVETDTEDELEELAATINQMAGSLQVRQEELSQRNRDMSLLYEVAHGMSECRELDDALELAIDQAMGVIKSGASAGCILLKNKDGEFDALACRTAASDVCNEAATRTFIRAAGEANRAGTASIFDSLKDAGSGDAAPFESCVCIPLKIEGEFKGTICIAGDKANFTEPAMELLAAIGSEVAIAIENSRLFSKMEKQKRELAMATIEIANLINRAEKNKSFGVRYRNPNLLNCWEANGCDVKACPAHGSDNPRCWQITGTLCDGEAQGAFAEKINKCEKCSVYQNACSDRITTVGETFNNMMAVLEGKVKEQEQLQLQLHNSSKLAAIGELAAGVAHEINNPLTGILANTMLLKQKPAGSDEDSKETRRKLEIIEGEALRAREIVRSLLDFARQSEMQTEPVAVAELVEHTLQLLKYEINKSQVAINKRFDEDLAHVVIDANQMKQVFLNIVHNAIQSMPSGGRLHIIAMNKEGNRECQIVEITFTDTGHGIDDESLERVFDPFFTTKVAGEGTGLGLSVSQRIVHDHGGNIRVQSEAGKGSTFTIELPATSPKDSSGGLDRSVA